MLLSVRCLLGVCVAIVCALNAVAIPLYVRKDSYRRDYFSDSTTPSSSDEPLNTAIKRVENATKQTSAAINQLQSNLQKMNEAVSSGLESAPASTNSSSSGSTTDSTDNSTTITTESTDTSISSTTESTDSSTSSTTESTDTSTTSTTESTDTSAGGGTGDDNSSSASGSNSNSNPQFREVSDEIQAQAECIERKLTERRALALQNGTASTAASPSTTPVSTSSGTTGSGNSSSNWSGPTVGVYTSSGEYGKVGEMPGRLPWTTVNNIAARALGCAEVKDESQGGAVSGGSSQAASASGAASSGVEDSSGGASGGSQKASSADVSSDKGSTGGGSADKP